MIRDETMHNSNTVYSTFFSPYLLGQLLILYENYMYFLHFINIELFYSYSSQDKESKS
jgi:hypothetical protein